ncbi:PREDICTED: neoverrucotoxin subunit alpha-like [Poecilia mexicana]|uniref:B30.2/SPRY domain-containing protein n=1 Tax=Poecilia mexicana TaxID=48701 RepID=A0A3B3YFM8_9TELE|nr:PREDICTED: neoverrucotoxin subunit alpha-like [Poecilia mexicana]
MFTSFHAVLYIYNENEISLFTGFTLWERETISSYLSSQVHPSSSYEISTSDSFESKSSLLDVNVSLKASFLGGLVEVGGSAGFLNDNKKLKNQSRVTFQYKATTFYDRLNLSLFQAVKLQDKDLVEKSDATHVVTGILYGANAFFVFDSEKLESSSVETVQAKMFAAVNKIPSFNIEARAEMKLTKEERDAINKFTCKFYGDFILEKNPTTFEDAVTTFSKLPELLGETKKNSVPVKVWLTPLEDLDVTGAELKENISSGLVRKFCNSLESIKEMERRCREAQEEKVVESFPQIRKKLKVFEDNCKDYTSNLSRAMQEKIPLIREGKEDERCVEKLFDEQEKSPFNHTTLDAWLDNAEREINIIMSCLDIMEGIPTVPDENSLDRQVLAAGVADLFCFVFSSVETDDPFLDQMTSYVSKQTKPPPSVAPPSKDQWFFSNEVVANMRKKAREFTSAAKQLKGSRRFRFLAAALPNKRFTGGTVYQFRDGSLKTQDFSRPDVPDVTAPLDRRDLAWYHCSLTLDPKTCNGWLNLSDGNRKATCGPEQAYPDNPQRFDVFTQGLSELALTGRRYFEVEWSTGHPNKVGVALVYSSMQRKGKDVVSSFGENPASWYFGVHNNELSAWHNGKIWSTSVPAGGCSRVGVYLDWPGGSLSFYQVSSDALTHMYTFRAKFTEPLHPGLYAYHISNFASFSPM